MPKNFWGKALLGAKKVGQTIGDAASDATAAAKKAAKTSMLKAEINGLEEKLGQVVYEKGLTSDNAEAVKLVEDIRLKYEELEKLQEDDDCDCGECTDENCDCDCHDEDDCHCNNENCDCHDDKNLDDKDLKNVMSNDATEVESNVLSEEDKKMFGDNENTDHKAE